MRNPDLCSRSFDGRKLSFTQVATLPLLVAGFALAGLPIHPANAATYYNPRPYRASVSDYEKCAEGLLGTGLGEAEATAACAAALYPKALSSCVTTIDAETELSATDALSGCRRVRRPQELASCVVGITEISTEGTEPQAVLTYCRRSLLPARFSNCVVGLATQAALSTTEMMTTCIAATNRPREVLPNFIPSGQPIPLQPLPGANLDTTTPVTPAPSQTTTTPSPVAPPATPPRSVPALW
ncbi:MAG: hypothetical protein EDM05_031970 [Leptolyngbya sp. IPPAS B-1204]|nr:hypothetical protein [Elainella sp. C42_A2020_010]RNJ66680.1 MAG: hypothetical protein EDM05_24105 [Leptolyngbya sp. IPPAS B-1204]